ncbi:hypothetical protein [Curtobacterium sp. MCSS17_016]|uniref:hypothetical protein n=1 Tax=Curtobacterium sp. MCSS17_016 TaxID=2175644 RepID=UPI000DA9C24B|nr:hypothetical protein [Curtobacterium sp. MCSS17_016]WIE80928.1 hypothetical protein DEJ19_020645 [Curtobacterium sp. MCSS17_016]
MTETKQRSALERLVGRPLPWLAWAWGALALVWIISAVADPSGFHTFMAIAWGILAALQIAGVVYTKRKARAAAAQDPSRDSATH